MRGADGHHSTIYRWQCAQTAYRANVQATSGDHQRQALFLHHGQQLVGWAGIRPGDRVLDVAAGTGASLLPAARIAGRQGRLIGVDIAPGMVERLSAIIAAEGLSNATVQVADAESLPFRDSSFDALLCGFALFFFTDIDDALAEFRRVLTPGGRLGLATFTQAGSRSIDRTWAVLGQYATVPPPPNPALRFDDPTRLHQVLVAAGFVDVELRVEPYQVVLDSADVWWQRMRSMEFRGHVDRLTPGVQAALRASAAREFGDSSRAGSITFPMDALLARALAPSRA
jgi:SAM-dependent methyltransferase